MRDDPVKCEAEHRQDRCLHLLKKLDPKLAHGFRWKCLRPKCGRYLYRKNGVVAL